MNYKIVQTKHQKFISIVRSFKNEIINDDDNHDIPDFWTECQENDSINKLLDLRKDSKKDLYGLCTPPKEGKDTFEYGIGVLMDEDTYSFENNFLEQNNFIIWNIPEALYVVFECIGDDGNCISETWSKFYKEFLPQTGYVVTEATDYEVYYQNSKSNLFCDLYIPIQKK